LPQYELNLRDYIRIFHKRRLTIIVTFLIVSIGGFINSSKQKVFYRASTTVKIEERKTVAGLLTEWLVYSPGDAMESETRNIKSFPILKRTALALKLMDENATQDRVNHVISVLQAAISTNKVGNTNMIEITTILDKPLDAVSLANKVAQAYIEENLEGKAKQFRNVRQFIEEQLLALETRLKEAENNLKQYGGESGNVILSEPIQQKLLTLQFELSELTQKYTEKHPRVLQLKSQIKDLESQIKGVSDQELGYVRLSREVEVNRKLHGMLKEKLEEARINEAQKVPDVSVVNPAVYGSPISANKNTIIITGLLLGLILGVAFAFVLETLDTSIATIEDVENLVKVPVLGIVPSVLQSESKGKKTVKEKIKSWIFNAPESKVEERQVRLSVHYKPTSPVAEAFRNIYTNIKISPSRKTILVTSSSPREGKSSVVCGLGMVMAQAGLKTLLVSTDLRRPSITRSFGIKREPGLNEFIMGSTTLEGALKNVTDIILGEMGLEEVRKTPGIENIWILPTGKLSDNPSEILGTKEFNSLIERLRAQFDVIIFDSPPVLPVADASILAPKLDCAIIVYEIGRTSREALMRTKTQLDSSGAKIIGIILNNIRPQIEAISPYPYYYRYKYRYTKEEEPKKK
jgi:tyrosine-protein kinase Etk/Wzc